MEKFVINVFRGTQEGTSVVVVSDSEYKDCPYVGGEEARYWKYVRGFEYERFCNEFFAKVRKRFDVVGKFIYRCNVEDMIAFIKETVVDKHTVDGVVTFIK